MKKKILNAVSTLAIAAIVALNVHVVTSEQTPAFLKWDVIGKILANGTSGSGSGSGSGGEIKYCWTSYSLGGILTVVPCAEYTPSTLPAYKCGTALTFCMPMGSRVQCY